nr:HDAC-5 [Neopyropia yezoensis]
MADVAWRVAPPASRAQLATAHTPAYVDAALTGALSAAAVRATGFPWSPDAAVRAAASTGGTVAAALGVLGVTGGGGGEGGGRIAGHVAGGTHHAHADRGAGFCVFNDIAVATRVVQAVHPAAAARVLIIDLDVHAGDGTAALFPPPPGHPAGTPLPRGTPAAPTVTTLSLHGATNWPPVKPPSTYDLPMADGATDADVLTALAAAIPRVVAATDPTLIFYQAGVDALAADTLGRLAMTPAGLRRRNRLVYRTALAAGVPLVVTMGGGYTRPVDASVAAHADVYLDARAALREVPPPGGGGG